MSQRTSTTRTSIFLLIAVLVGAAIGYVSALQTTVGQIESLQNQITQLQSNQPSGNIIVKGSDTLLIVAQQWAEEYMNQYSGVSISVAGGGSGVGIAALIDSTTDIADKVASTSNGLLDPADVNVYYLDGPDSNGDVGDRGDSVVVESDYEYGLITPLSAFLDLAFDSIDFHSCTDMRLELPVSGASNPGGDLGCE